MRRILSLDGGGIKGVFPASFLASVEDATGSRVADYFDLIVGTSTGGIIALGLGLGFSAAEILPLYERLGPRVFQGGASWLRRVVAAKYDPGPLREALQEQFGDRLLGKSSTRLVVPSLNLETGEVHVYKTAHHPRFERDHKERAVDVALATAAAPTYFPVQQTTSAIPLVDGGLWANNPVGMAVVEAVGVLGWPKEDLRVLSLGCTTEAPRGAAGSHLPYGYAFWLPRIIELFMAAQSSASSGTAALLAGHQNVLRISPTVSRGRFGMDRIEDIAALRGLGETEARKALPTLRTMFLGEPAEVFRPY